jgi:hypothetical protein
MSLPLFRSSLLFLVFVVGSACFLAAQYPMPLPHAEQADTKTADIREVVSKYCRLDYEGARLDGQGWAKIEPVVSWKSNPDYAEINIISRYMVDPELTESHGKYTVTVHYRLLGSYNLVTGYVPEAPNTPQNVEYTVTDIKGDVRILDSENTLPHPSRAAMLKWLNEKLNATQDDVAKRRYQDALRQLQAQPASPFTK